MYLQIKTLELVPDKYGKHIKITKIGLYEDDGTWVRWVKLNEKLAETLKNEIIDIGNPK